MNCKYIILVSLQLICIQLFAQNSKPCYGIDLDTIVFSGKNDFFIFGEDHRMNNTYHKIELVNIFGKNTEHFVVALEYPRTLQKLCNDYITLGDEYALCLLKQERFFTNENDQWLLLEGLKSINDIYPNRVSICCFDTEAYTGKDSFMGIKKMINYHRDSTLNQLYNICDEDINTVEDINRVIGLIRTEIGGDTRKKYIDILGSNYRVLEEALIGIEVNTNNGTLSLKNESGRFAREQYLAEVLNMESTSSEMKMIVFTGSAHSNLFCEDSILESRSLVCQLRDIYKREVLSYYTLYHNRRTSLIDKFYADLIDYLNVDLFSCFEDASLGDYAVINKEGLIGSPFLYERCDGVIVKNCKKKKR